MNTEMTIPAYATRTGSVKARTGHTIDLFEIDGQGPWAIRSQIESVLRELCGRCGGEGDYSYNPLDGTICYGCGGSGVGKEITWDDASRIAKRRAADAKRKKAQYEKIAAAAFLTSWDEAITWNAFRTENADVIAFLADQDGREGFIGDMARKIAALTILSERMIAAVRKCITGNAARTTLRKSAGHVGTVGKRDTFEVRILTVRPIETNFSYHGSTSYLIVMETRDGAGMKTFGTGDWCRNAEANADAWLTIKATVKAHEEYNGEPQTVLTRVASA